MALGHLLFALLAQDLAVAQKLLAEFAQVHHGGGIAGTALDQQQFAGLFALFYQGIVGVAHRRKAAGVGADGLCDVSMQYSA